MTGGAGAGGGTTGGGTTAGGGGDGDGVTVGDGVGVGDGVALGVGITTERLGAGAAGCALAQPAIQIVAPNAAATMAGREIFMVPSEGS
jgi:hypothetical protein